MAYKFQLGPAVLSGSLTQEGNVLAKDAKISGSTIAVTDASGLVGNGIQTGSAPGSLEIKFKAGTASGLAADTEGMFITSSGVTNDMLSGSIGAGKIQLGEGLGDVGGAVAIDLDGNDTGLVLGSGGLALSGTIPGARTFSGNVTIAGDLVVEGSSVEIQQGFVVTSSVQFEGSTPDGNELTLTSADPTAARTITLPDLSGHVPLLAGAVSNANVTAAEFALLDGDAASIDTGIVVSDTDDGFLMNDNGSLRYIGAANLKNYFQTGVTADSANSLRLNGAGEVVAADQTVDTDVTLVDSSGDVALTMPDITTDEIGKVYIIKDITGNAGTGNPIFVISSSAGHNLDGEDSITIESEFGAVNLLACSASEGFFYSIF